MGTAVYVDANAGTSVLSLDDTVVSDSSTIAVQVSTVQQTTTVTTEAALRNAEAATTITTAVQPANDSVTAIEANLENTYIAVEVREDGSLGNTEPVEVIVIPDSWIPKMNMDKWTRLCYEQQKASFEWRPFWHSISEFPSTIVTPGYNSATIDFPILPYSTNLFSVKRREDRYCKIDSTNTNAMVEDIQINYRKALAIDQMGLGYDLWKPWVKVDAEDDPISWNSVGKYQFVSYPTIDSKQVPMLCSTMDLTAYQLQGYQGYETVSTMDKTYKDLIGQFDYLTIDQDLAVTETATLIPVWFGDTVKVYYYIPSKSHVHEIDLSIDNVVRGTITTKSLDTHEGWITIGSFNRGVYPKDHIIRVNRYHLTKYTGGTSTGRSLIDTFEIKIKPGMVSSDNFTLSSTGITGFDEDGFKFKLRGPIDTLYKPDTIEKAFQVDLRQSPEPSNWFSQLQQQRKVVRLVVSKIYSGVESHVGNFILNPVATSGDAINELCNLDQNLTFVNFGSDSQGQFIQFAYDPHAGPAGLLNSRVDGDHFYLFRLAEWTVGVESALLSDESVAWITNTTNQGENQEYRYDSWDEEHPVRKWLRMSPVNPRDDSISRCTKESEGHLCYMVPTNTTGRYDESPPPMEYIVSTQEDFQWNTIYSDVLPSQASAYLTYPYFSFRFKLDGLFGLKFRRLLIRASYYRPSIVEVALQAEVPQGEVTTYSEQNAEMAAAQTLNDTQRSQWTMTEVSSCIIAEFDEYSDIYDVRDFVSYPFVFDFVFRQLKANEIFMEKMDDDDSNTGSENHQMQAQVANFEDLVVPAESTTIDEETYVQYSRFLRGKALGVQETIRQAYFIKYEAIVIGEALEDTGAGYMVKNNQGRIENLADHGLWNVDMAVMGGLREGLTGRYVGFNFDLIQQSAENTAYLPAAATALTNYADQFTRSATPNENDETLPDNFGGVCGWTGVTTRVILPSEDEGDGLDTASGDGTAGSYVSVSSDTGY